MSQQEGHGCSCLESKVIIVSGMSIIADHFAGVAGMERKQLALQHDQQGFLPAVFWSLRGASGNRFAFRCAEWAPFKAEGWAAWPQEMKSAPFTSLRQILAQAGPHHVLCKVPHESHDDHHCLCLQMKSDMLQASQGKSALPGKSGKKCTSRGHCLLRSSLSFFSRGGVCPLYFAIAILCTWPVLRHCLVSICLQMLLSPGLIGSCFRVLRQHLQNA